MFKVIVTDCIFRDLKQEEAILKRVDAEIIGYQCTTADEVIRVAGDADAILTSQFKCIDRNIIEHLKKCRVIVRYGIGVDTIDIHAATQNGILVVNVPEYCIDEVSDHAVALVLALSRSLCMSNAEIRSGSGYRIDYSNPLHSLKSSTIGIIGFGRIGRQTGRKMSVFSSDIRFFDPFIPEDVHGCGVFFRKSSLDDLLQTSDFIILNAPLTKETHHLIDGNAVARMARKPYLVNVSRGELVDSEALLLGIENGSIRGAALDVVEGVPPLPGGDPLLKNDRIIFTPHSAWYSEESLCSLQRTAAEEVARVLGGEMPRSLLNQEAWGRKHF
jgi:D-3-phosphoglycerate dehydrogenase